MKSINSYVNSKMNLRKKLMIIFSCCSILLICGIFSALQDAANPADDNLSMHLVSKNNAELNNSQDYAKIYPREMLMEKRDKKIRLYMGIALFAIMLSTFAVDIIWVRCPVCSGHIRYGINPESCSHCGASFLRKENEL